MIILLDTQSVLWFWWDDPRLSSAARTVIRDPANRKLVNTATPWEVAIKVSLKKLNIGGDYQGFFPHHMKRTRFDWLPCRDEHLSQLITLPYHHRDPFDRLLIAQAQVEQISIVSSDAKFDLYSISRIW